MLIFLLISSDQQRCQYFATPGGPISIQSSHNGSQMANGRKVGIMKKYVSYRETRTPVRSFWTGKRIGSHVTRRYK
jgi:hypothetical protein